MNLQNNNSAAGAPAPSSSGGLFGNPTGTGATGNGGATTGAPSSIFGGGFNLGGLGGAFGATTTGSTSTSNSGTNPPAGGNIFGNTTNPTTTGGGGTGSSNPLFGGTPSTGGSSNAFGGSSLFGGPKLAEQGGAAAAKPATSSFFTQPTNASSTTSATAAPAATPAAGLSLGVPSSTSTSKDAEKPAASTSSATNVSSAVAVPPPSALRGKNIEDIVNRWSADLETHVREFNKFAGEVAVWDRALVENGNNLAALYSHVLATEREQNDIDQALDHIEQQQKDLSTALDTYEKSTQEILGGNLRGLDTGPADTERDKNYMLATDLHTHLDDLSGSLTQMIEAVNALSLPSASGAADSSSGEDPMSQISQILSSHLESLQWIDGAVREVEGKVTEVEKRVKDSGSSTGLSGPGSKSRGFGLNR